MTRNYYVYVMASHSRTLYTGVTNDVYRRAIEHKTGRIRGFTSKYNVNRLVYFERYADVRRAIEREKQVKGWTRAKKLALIESANAGWADLAEHLAPAAQDPSHSLRMTASALVNELSPSSTASSIGRAGRS
jgi:putative endonuclease